MRHPKNDEEQQLLHEDKIFCTICSCMPCQILTKLLILLQSMTLKHTCAFLRSPPVLPPKMGAGVEGSKLGGEKGFFSSFFSFLSEDFSLVAPSAATRTLQHIASVSHMAAGFSLKLTKGMA